MFEFRNSLFILQKDSIRYILLQFFSQIKKYVKICFYSFYATLQNKVLYYYRNT